MVLDRQVWNWGFLYDWRTPGLAYPVAYEHLASDAAYGDQSCPRRVCCHWPGAMPARHVKACLE